MIVADASVVLKWILLEESREKALELRERHIKKLQVIAAPELLFYEVANALVMKSKLREEEILRCFSLIYSMELETFNLRLKDYIDAISLCRKFQITIYDASYIILSQLLDSQFITADEALWEKTRNFLPVKLLSQI